MTQPLGEAPCVATFDKIDRAWNKTQRHNSPLTGAYSCCRMNHVVTSKDGAKTKIGCDKDALKGVLHTLFDRKVSELREACKQEGHQTQAQGRHDARGDEGVRNCRQCEAQSEETQGEEGHGDEDLHLGYVGRPSAPRK